MIPWWECLLALLFGRKTIIQSRDGLHLAALWRGHYYILYGKVNDEIH